MSCDSCVFWKKAKSINVGECERAVSFNYKCADPTSTAWADGSDAYPGVLNTLPTHSCSMYERNKGRALKGEKT